MNNIKNISESDYNKVAGNSWPSYKEFLKGIKSSDPLINKEIDQFVNNTKLIYNNKYDYLSRAPHYVDKDDLTDVQAHRLMHSNTFCMLPWVHMHAFPDGRAYPCCLSEYWHPVGDLRKNTMEQVWNQDPYKNMRKNMLEDKPCKECSKCYEQESNGFFSLRYDSNRNYGHHIPLVDKTLADGTNPEFNLRYWDVRFSNLCNFSCRTCGPIFSSNWYKDHVKLYDRKPDVLGREMERVEYTAGDEDTMMKQMLPHIPYLEQVYFAGGEPLIMKEHYFMLEKLIEYGKTDIRIQYNTNFSELAFKDKHVFEYWKHFKNVSVGASLDASGARGELMRKGTDWNQVIANRLRMIEEVPHVDFYVASTVSAMNILHVLDFHKEWADLGLIKPRDWNINVCQSPEWYRVDILPRKFKENVVIPAYEDHIKWLDPQDSLRRATNGYKSVVSMMQNTDASHLLPKFKQEVEKLDQVRNENFWKVFPELNELA